MSAVNQMLSDLENGHTIGTDNATASRYGVNKVPDVIYKLRRKGISIETVDKLIMKNGKPKKVAEYRMVSA